jgi:hypothetical protein
MTDVSDPRSFILRRGYKADYPATAMGQLASWRMEMKIGFP